jgi:hypothetical protein
MVCNAQETVTSGPKQCSLSPPRLPSSLIICNFQSLNTPNSYLKPILLLSHCNMPALPPDNNINIGQDIADARIQKTWKGQHHDEYRQTDGDGPFPETPPCSKRAWSYLSFDVRRSFHVTKPFLSSSLAHNLMYSNGELSFFFRSELAFCIWCKSSFRDKISISSTIVLLKLSSMLSR